MLNYKHMKQDRKVRHGDRYHPSFVRIPMLHEGVFYRGVSQDLKAAEIAQNAAGLEENQDHPRHTCH